MKNVKEKEKENDISFSNLFRILFSGSELQDKEEGSIMEGMSNEDRELLNKALSSVEKLEKGITEIPKVEKPKGKGKFNTSKESKFILSLDSEKGPKQEIEQEIDR